MRISTLYAFDMISSKKYKPRTKRRSVATAGLVFVIATCLINNLFKASWMLTADQVQPEILSIPNSKDQTDVDLQPATLSTPNPQNQTNKDLQPKILSTPHSQDQTNAGLQPTTLSTPNPQNQTDKDLQPATLSESNLHGRTNSELQLLLEKRSKDNEIVGPGKFYAVHIGPSKTGTSAIQRYGKRNPFQEKTFGPDKDNIIYVGKRTGDFDNWVDEQGGMEIRVVERGGDRNATVSLTPKNEQNAYFSALGCMEKILDGYYDTFSNSTIDNTIINQRLESDEETRASLRRRFIDECWIQKVKKKGRVDFSYMLDSSILDSNEGFSYARQNSVHKRFRCFDILGYDRLILVGAYRRYADWLVSAYTQHIKEPCLFPNLKKGEKKDIPCLSLRSFVQRHIRRKRPEALYRVRSAYDPVSTTLPKILRNGPSKLQARILNYFQLAHISNDEQQEESSGFKFFDSITTELYCDAFGESLTPHSCSSARKNTRKKSSKSALVANKGEFSNSVYQRIVAEGYRYGFLLLTDQELEERKKECKHIWCDSTCEKTKTSCTKQNEKRRQRINEITMGGENTIVGTNSSNITMFKDLADYHSDVHRKSWTESLPIKCLERKLLEKLLKKSLAFEELVMPEFHASPLGKEEHIRLFWDVWLKKKKHFCGVDTVRLFRGATTWDEIINKRMVSHDWGEEEVESTVD